MADNPQLDDGSSEVISENLSQQKEESREEMLSRHRKETSDLQNKETAMKKGAAKGSKAEQKAKKKQVDEEIHRLSTELKERQADELASLGYNSNNNTQKANLETLVKAIAGVSVNPTSEQSTKPSKSIKRREKRAQQEAEREQRIQQEQSQIVSDGSIETVNLAKKLEPLGFTINEIKPDGHCLYRAVENQLSLHSSCTSYTYQELRKMVADYMRKHSSDFVPFFLSEKAGDGEEEEGSVMERFESYCKEVECSAAWGGQLEIEALTHCLKKHVMIYSGSFPDVEMGKEYKSSEGSIMLSYHRHAFGLGEHYNSVVPSSLH
ncbi:hypothetical protein ABFS83_02G072700 [Erythranthe nasuta]